MLQRRLRRSVVGPLAHLLSVAERFCPASPMSEYGTMTQSKRKTMNNQFDELTKRLAQSVTRRGALKKFGVGLAGMALACFGLANKSQADPKPTCLQPGQACTSNSECCSGVCY